MSNNPNGSYAALLISERDAEAAEKELAQSRLRRATSKADALLKKSKDLNFQLAIHKSKTKSLLDGIKEHLPKFAQLIDELEIKANKIHDEDQEWLTRRREWTDYEIDKEEHDRSNQEKIEKANIRSR